MNNSSGVSYLKPAFKASEKQRDTQSKTIEKLSQIALSELSILLQSLFDGIDDSFFELANSSRTNNEQNRFFEAMREIRIKRKGIENDFLQKVQALYTPEQIASGLSPKAKTSSPSDEITLVQRGDLEEDVAIHAMTAKAQATFKNTLNQFNTRLRLLYGMSDQSAYSSPLNPHKICLAFASACAALEIAIKERLIVLKQFDRFVMSHLDQLLTPSNQLLLQTEVTKGLEILRTPEHSQSPSNENSTISLAQDNTPNSKEETHTKPLKLQSLLYSIREANPNKIPSPQNNASNASEPPLSSSELLAILRDIQLLHTEKLSQGPISKTLDIRNTITKALEAAGINRSLKQTDEDLVNLVAMLFDFILEDYNLSPAIQALLGYLQPPILQVVIQDKSFFSSSNHPARQLLNTLARAGIGYVDSPNPNKDQLFNRIYQAVYRTLSEFDGDTELFDKLNQEFCVFIEKESRKARLTENRTQKSEEGRAKSFQAQQKVENVLSNKILNTHHPIPTLIIETLKNGWARVMFLAYLKDEQEHQWRNSIRVVEDLIWCVQPLVEPADRQKWIKTVPKLLKDLKSGLEVVSYKTSTLDSLVKDIQKTLTEIYKAGHLPEEDRPASKQPTLLDSPASEAKELSPQAEQALGNLKVGQWFELVSENGKKSRCKLSTYIPEADCYVFVNRMGLKTLERNQRELANDLQQGKLISLSQGQIIDRAMNAVMSTLRLK